jgi:hypothetical protein
MFLLDENKELPWKPLRTRSAKLESGLSDLRIVTDGLGVLFPAGRVNLVESARPDGNVRTGIWMLVSVTGYSVAEGAAPGSPLHKLRRLQIQRTEQFPQRFILSNLRRITTVVLFPFGRLSGRLGQPIIGTLW